MNTIVAHAHSFVIGVDTHAKTHTYAVLAGRRGIGKSDPIDAQRIAAAVLPLPEEQLRTPRMDEGVRAATQILLTSRDGLTSERSRAVNALTALVRIADLGIDARRPLGARQIGEIARWRPREEDLAATTARTEAVRLAKRILALDTEIADNMKADRRARRRQPCGRPPRGNRDRPRHRRHRPGRLVPPGTGP